MNYNIIFGLVLVYPNMIKSICKLQDYIEFITILIENYEEALKYASNRLKDNYYTVNAAVKKWNCVTICLR